MATGFMQRFRGKIHGTQVWAQEFITPPPGITASTSVALTYASLQVLPASSLAQVFTLPPPQLGRQVTLATSTGVAVGTGTRVVNATTGSQFASTSTTLTFSTLTPQAVTLYGVSTILWAIENSTTTGPVML